MSTNNKIVWTRRKSKRTIAPVLLARRISAEWLASSFDMVSVRFQGPQPGVRHRKNHGTRCRHVPKRRG